MKKYIAPIVAILIGFVLLGPIGAVLAYLVWYVMSHRTSSSPK